MKARRRRSFDGQIVEESVGSRGNLVTEIGHFTGIGHLCLFSSCLWSCATLLAQPRDNSLTIVNPEEGIFTRFGPGNFKSTPIYLFSCHQIPGTVCLSRQAFHVHGVIFTRILTIHHRQNFTVPLSTKHPRSHTMAFRKKTRLIVASVAYFLLLCLWHVDSQATNVREGLRRRNLQSENAPYYHNLTTWTLGRPNPDAAIGNPLKGLVESPIYTWPPYTADIPLALEFYYVGKNLSRLTIIICLPPTTANISSARTMQVSTKLCLETQTSSASRRLTGQLWTTT